MIFIFKKNKERFVLWYEERERRRICRPVMLAMAEVTSGKEETKKRDHCLHGSNTKWVLRRITTAQWRTQVGRRGVNRDPLNIYIFLYFSHNMLSSVGCFG